jgi:hypothetical protein
VNKQKKVKKFKIKTKKNNKNPCNPHFNSLTAQHKRIKTNRINSKFNCTLRQSKQKINNKKQQDNKHLEQK